MGSTQFWPAMATTRFQPTSASDPWPTVSNSTYAPPLPIHQSNTNLSLRPNESSSQHRPISKSLLWPTEPVASSSTAASCTFLHANRDRFAWWGYLWAAQHRVNGLFSGRKCSAESNAPSTAATPECANDESTRKPATLPQTSATTYSCPGWSNRPINNWGNCWRICDTSYPGTKSDSAALVAATHEPSCWWQVCEQKTEIFLRVIYIDAPIHEGL